jgi:hypothetical protein
MLSAIQPSERRVNRTKNGLATMVPAQVAGTIVHSREASRVASETAVSSVHYCG